MTQKETKHTSTILLMEQAELEQHLFKCRLTLTKEMAKIRKLPTQTQTTMQEHTPPKCIQLPTIDLSEVDGKEEDWTPYWDQFSDLVHNRNGLGSYK